MEQKVVIIIGLPGSGKTTFIEQHQDIFNDFVICDDYHKSALHKSRAFKDSVYYNDVQDALASGKSVAMADIAWCKPDRLNTVTDGLDELFKTLQINPKLEFIYFENNPEACKRNAVHRGRKDRIDREIEFIDEISKQYRIPSEIIPIKIGDYYIMDLYQYLQSSTKSLFRFEALQEYKVEGDGFDDEEIKEWWNFIETKTESGVRMERVRLVVEPLNDYTKNELIIHQQSKTFGDDIRIIKKDVFDTLNIALKDFWMIDDRVILLMDYSETGEYLGFKVIEDNIDKYLTIKNELLGNSNPLPLL